MHAYIAFNPHDATCCEEVGQIPCKAFAPPGKYVPLKDSIIGALNQALGAKTPSLTPLKAAKEPTMWFILEVALSTQKALELFQEGVLSRSQSGWRWYNDLDLDEVTGAKWLQILRAPIGMEQWAAKVLSSWNKTENGSCAERGATNVKVWTGTLPRRLDYCCGCWYRFLLAQSTKGIYKPMEKMQKPGQKPAVGQKPATPQKMQAYIASNDWARLKDNRLVVPCKGWRPNNQYVPLRESAAAALGNAMDNMRHDATYLEVALKYPDWYILKMTSAAPTALNFFQEAALVRMEEGWRFYGDLPLSEAESLEWIQCKVRPPVIMTWRMSPSEDDMEGHMEEGDMEVT